MELNSAPFDGETQQCIREVNLVKMNFFHRIEELFPGMTEDMSLQHQYVFKCMVCQNTRMSGQEPNDLCIPLTDRLVGSTSLQQLIDLYTEDEVLDDLICSKCKKATQNLKTTQFVNDVPPSCVVVHLKVCNNSLQKLHHSIRLDEEVTWSSMGLA
jgi:hypothetical protein